MDMVTSFCVIVLAVQFERGTITEGIHKTKKIFFHFTCSTTL